MSSYGISRESGMAAASRYPSCSGSSSSHSPQMITVGAVIVPHSDGGTAVVSPARPAFHTWRHHYAQAQLGFLDDGPQKPIQIWSRLSRRPLLAGGN
jgi:hypothetical protein